MWGPNPGADPMTISRLALTLVALVLLASTFGVAVAGDERPKLVDHPMKDAKAGEYLRFEVVDDKWTRYYIERVLEVKDGKVLWEIARTNEDGSKQLGRERMGYITVPPLKAADHQRVIEDDMRELEIGGKKLWCRRFLIEELVDPDAPWGEKRSKEVWYSNDIPCSGKVKDSVNKRVVTKWGMMPEDEVKKRLEAYKKELEKRRTPGSN